MSKTCRLCSVPHGEIVVCRLDGSNRWALDLDLCKEWPKDWGEPTRAIVEGNDVCLRCNLTKALEKR